MSLNIKGIGYRIQRFFGVTDYDRELRRKKCQKTDLTTEESVIASLSISPLSDLPVPLSASVAYLVYFLLGCAMVFFVFQGFTTARQEKFLALSESAGVCEKVPKIISGVYKFDDFGNWEGSEHFQISRSIYQLTLNRIQLTNEQFVSLAALALSQLHDLSTREASKRSLVENLVFWMSWSINTVESGNRQHFRLTGDAKTLYNQGTNHASGLSSLAGRCNVSSAITFEKASGIYRIHYSYAEYISNEVCMKAADPRNLDFRPGMGTDAFTLEFDMQSVMTVLGVNYGIIDYEVLEEVPFTRGELELSSGVQVFANYYNPRYPNMNVITCFANQNTSSPEFSYDRVSICAVEIGLTPMYPVFNHLGYNQPGLDETLYCDCSEEVLSNRELSYECNKFLMLTGFIFYNTDFDNQPNGPPLSLEYFSQLDKKYDGDERKLELNRDAYNISKDAVHFAEDDYFNSAGREAHYDFCTLEADAPCSILTIHTSAGGFYGVSEDYYQIPYGHCNDSVTVSAEAQASMEVPPVPLTENYLECRRTLADTLLTSIGIAVGNVLSVRSGLVIVFTLWLARYTSSGASARSGAEGSEPSSQFITYGTVERDKVLQYLAFNLLLARDGKYRAASAGQHSGRRQEGAGTAEESSLVTHLAEELGAHPSLRRFFRADGTTCSERDTHHNPLQAAGEGEDIELSGGQSPSGSRDTSSPPPHRRPGPFRRRREKAFVEEVLHNPMYLTEAEKGGGDSR
mmetsp:Transcript_25031/g.46762  ORF Transcript_25031/g.46762 Transcript_25031/m.46762 type:complete len:743 (+) Transcript_25031:137-2365(+)